MSSQTYVETRSPLGDSSAVTTLVPAVGRVLISTIFSFPGFRSSPHRR